MSLLDDVLERAQADDTLDPVVRDLVEQACRRTTSYFRGRPDLYSRAELEHQLLRSARHPALMPVGAPPSTVADVVTAYLAQLS